jgi:hypothetical protein
LLDNLKEGCTTLRRQDSKKSSKISEKGIKYPENIPIYNTSKAKHLLINQRSTS